MSQSCADSAFMNLGQNKISNTFHQDDTDEVIKQKQNKHQKLIADLKQKQITLNSKAETEKSKYLEKIILKYKKNAKNSNQGQL